MAFCRKCGQYFKTSGSNHNSNQKDCPKHSFWMTRGGGKYLGSINAKAAELKKAADQSGDPKIWTAQKYSQEFLRSLIPRNQ